LRKKKISIIGTRKPSKYTREFTAKLAKCLSQYGVCIVSGGAMGVDALAHNGAGSKNTIAVLPCGIDIKYPKINIKLLDSIENEGLLLSQFEKGFTSRPWTFVVRNELVVALGDVLVVCEADLKSGSMRSVEFALSMGKEIYVLPHRLGESLATQELLKEGKAKTIYNIEDFVSTFSNVKKENTSLSKDDFLNFCAQNPTYKDALLKFPSRVFEAELNGEIEIMNGNIRLI
jgi:DNA processing protein